MKVASSAGSKESVLRPSKPAPKTMKGEPLHWPRSNVDELGVEVEAVMEAEDEDDEVVVDGVLVLLLLLPPVFALHEPLEDGEVEGEDEDAGAEAVEAVGMDAGADEAMAPPLLLTDVAPAAATAEFISSAVTSGTRRFCERMHPTGSVALSPI